MSTYISIQGDTWDIIAYKTLGNSMYADRVMKENPSLLNIFVFSAGTIVNIPEIDEEVTDELPPWRIEN